jgi:glycerate kinase
MNPVKAKYCILNSENLAVMEMAEAAGINLISRGQLNPMNATTFGVGEMIKDAMDRGCRKFIIGIGGSATNDGGIGMLQALGFAFLDDKGQPIPLGAKGIEHLQSISADGVAPELKNCKFRIACDVNNPLCGENGCSRIFAPQKGATEDMILQMDGWLERYVDIAKTYNPNADANRKGAGAAGGLGFAFATFTNATLEPGVQIVLDETKLEEYIKNADVVITGEGRLDAQTVMGKAPIGVAKLAKKHGKIVIAFSGCVTEDADVCNLHGIDAFFPILRKVTTLDEALDTENAYRNLKDTAYQVFRLLSINK